MRPTLLGIHHVKLAVADLGRSLAFFERCFAACRISEADHHHQKDGSLYACILRIPGLDAMLELRLNPEQAIRNKLFDPITFAVQGYSELEP